VRQWNRGQGAARNEGLKHVTGTFVVFLDSDDRLLPSALDTGVRCFEAHPERAFVAGRSVGLVRTAFSGTPRRNRSSTATTMWSLLRNNYIWTPGTAMFRTARFRREAEVLGAFNHPHIGQINGLENQEAGLAGRLTCPPAAQPLHG
jgi:cellulose synthase/poly-beta-1,6-N-acetylglucosamine synthase-like glycosyltransferase